MNFSSENLDGKLLSLLQRLSSFISIFLSFSCSFATLLPKIFIWEYCLLFSKHFGPVMLLQRMIFCRFWFYFSIENTQQDQRIIFNLVSSSFTYQLFEPYVAVFHQWKMQIQIQTQTQLQGQMRTQIQLLITGEHQQISQPTHKWAHSRC